MNSSINNNNNTIIISIFGITGTKGKSLCKSLLNKYNNGNNTNSKKLVIQGFTRDISSKKSQKLSKLGVEMIELNLITATIDQLNQLLCNSYSVFLVTDYFNMKEKEIECGIKVIDSCCKSNVQHLIYSGLPNISSIIDNTNIKLDLFKNKFEIEKYIKLKHSQNLLKYISIVYIPFYYQNFIDLFPPFKITNINKFNYENFTLNYSNYITIPDIYPYTNNYNINEFYSIPLPLKPNSSIYLCDRNEIGTLLTGIMDKPTLFNGKSIPFYGSLINPIEISKSLSKKLNKNIQYFYIPIELYKHFIPSSNNIEISNIFYFFNEFNSKFKEIIENEFDLSLFYYILSPSTINDYLSKYDKIKIKTINL